MHGTLFVVGTPIGNLEDITLRALRVLREVDLIAAEDTRHTRHLLQHHGIPTPTISLHQHNERVRTRQLLDRLMAGASVAVVSDAGMPGLSDPGAHLVREARAAGLDVQVVPGPSAVTAALTGAGIEASLVTFAGFPAARGKDRREWFERVGSLEGAVIFFEAPHRLARTLEEALRTWGDRELTIARELTKIHENFVTNPISVFMRDEFRPRGEHTLILWPAAGANGREAGDVTDARIVESFYQKTKSHAIGRGEALKAVAMELKVSRKRVFNAIEGLKSRARD